MQKIKKVSLFSGERKLDQANHSFRNNNIIIISIDESGTFAPLPKDSKSFRKNVTVVATIVRDRNRFNKTMRLFPKFKGRVKYNNTSEPEMSHIINDLKNQDLTVFENHVPRTDLRLKSKKGQKEVYMELISGVLNKALDHIPMSKVDVVIDQPPLNVLMDLELLGKDLIKIGKHIEWFEVDSSNTNNTLAVADFPVGVVADYVENIEKTNYLFRKLKDKVNKK